MRIRERLRWRPTWATIAIVLLVVWQLFLQPIWNLNIERVAEQGKIDSALRDNLPLIGGVVVPNVIIEWVNYLTGPFLTGFAIAAAIFGLGPSIASIMKPLLSKARQWSSKTYIALPVSPKPQDREREVIPVTLRIWGTMTGDGVDIEPQLIFRNRSLFNLKVKPTEATYFLGNKEPVGSPSRGFSADLKKESNGEVSFNPIRIHDTTKMPSGMVSVAFVYGVNEENMKTKIRLSYQFEVISLPDKTRARQKLKSEARQYCVYEDT